MSECALCKLEPITREHYRDEAVVIVDCMTCNVPMGVILRHSSTPTVGEVERIESRMRQLFGDAGRIDWTPRAVPGHAHCHLRSG